MALTDDELIKLAKNSEDVSEDLHDVWYYQQSHCIFDGNYAILTNHLYHHYKNWSADPIGLACFVDFLKLNNKNEVVYAFPVQSKCAYVSGDIDKTEVLQALHNASKQLNTNNIQLVE